MRDGPNMRRMGGSGFILAALAALGGQADRVMPVWRGPKVSLGPRNLVPDNRGTGAGVQRAKEREAWEAERRERLYAELDGRRG